VARVIATAAMTRLELQRLERAAVAARVLPQAATQLGKGGVAYVFSGCELPLPLARPDWSKAAQSASQYDCVRERSWNLMQAPHPTCVALYQWWWILRQSLVALASAACYSSNLCSPPHPTTRDRSSHKSLLASLDLA
jgi:hypothetical protein